MIEIRYEPGRRVSIEGHAGYAEKGKDIVCAAISALFCTMALDEGIGSSQDGESMSAMLIRPQSEAIFRAFIRGMKQVAEQYPTYVQFRTEKIRLK